MITAAPRTFPRAIAIQRAIIRTASLLTISVAASRFTI
jgi:hypothetical protein